jgi:hypothetical protein
MGAMRCASGAGLRAALLVAGAVVAGGVAASGTQNADAASILERLHAYLEQYEPKLSELVADEVFDQIRTGASRDLERRRLVSDFGFLRLPGGDAWLGQRSVREMDGRRLGSAQRLDDVFARIGIDIAGEAKAIALGNAVHNLGHPRTMNTPTLPLELLGRRHAARYVAGAARPDRIAGRELLRLDVRERRPGAIIARDATSFVTADVRAWIAPGGELVRAIVTMQAPAGRAPHRIQVDYAFNAALSLMVPVRLTESIAGRTSVSGTATYSNYRRFQTSGRLVPPGR